MLYLIEIETKGRSFAHHTSSVWVYIFLGRADFRFSIYKYSFWELSAQYKCSTTYICWLAPTLLSACLRCRALIGTYSLGCVWGLIALRCVLCLRYCNTVSVCLRCRTLIGTYLLCGFVRCCAALAVLLLHSCSSRCSTTKCSYMVRKKAHKKSKNWKNILEALFFSTSTASNFWRRKKTRRQVIIGGRALRVPTEYAQK